MSAAAVVVDREEEPEVHLYQIWLCDLCVAGAGGECHSPGCSLWLRRAPDLPLMPEMCERFFGPAEGP